MQCLDETPDSFLDLVKKNRRWLACKNRRLLASRRKVMPPYPAEVASFYSNETSHESPMNLDGTAS
jgi:hypothetical protein